MTTSTTSNWGPFSLVGRRAIVTGGSRGIGFGIVQRYLEAGASVLVTSRNEEQVRRAVEELGGDSDRLRGLAVDVTAEDAGPRMVDATVEAFGGVDILVNNAGIFPYRPMMQTDRALFEQVLSVNLVGLAFCAQAAAARMIEQGTGGAIVNIASIDSVHPSMVGLAAYDTSKGGLLMFTRSLALELGPYGIRVNALAPGAVDTPGAAEFVETLRQEIARAPEAARPSAALSIPLGRSGVPDDIATVAVFLGSDASRYMTGAFVPVDGGALIA